MNRNAVLVFLRRELPGQVKTRLSCQIGIDQALNVYQWLLFKTYEQLKKSRTAVYLYYDQKEGPTSDFLKDYEERIQEGKDLGVRMMKAMSESLVHHDKSLIIGSDCPEISSKDFSATFDFLEGHDLVLGPAFDGGVYLIGMKIPHEKLFDDVLWGNDSVCKSILDNARKLKLSVKMLETKRDVDRPEDLNFFKEEYQKYHEKRRKETERAG